MFCWVKMWFNWIKRTKSKRNFWETERLWAKSCPFGRQLWLQLPAAFWRLSLTARDKWPLKSHDHLIHWSLGINYAFALLSGTYHRVRNTVLVHSKKTKNCGSFCQFVTSLWTAKCCQGKKLFETSHTKPHNEVIAREILIITIHIIFCNEYL